MARRTAAEAELTPRTPRAPACSPTSASPARRSTRSHRERESPGRDQPPLRRQDRPVHRRVRRTRGGTRQHRARSSRRKADDPRGVHGSVRRLAAIRRAQRLPPDRRHRRTRRTRRRNGIASTPGIGLATMELGLKALHSEQPLAIEPSRSSPSCCSEHSPRPHRPRPRRRQWARPSTANARRPHHHADCAESSNAGRRISTIDATPPTPRHLANSATEHLGRTRLQRRRRVADRNGHHRKSAGDQCGDAGADFVLSAVTVRLRWTARLVFELTVIFLMNSVHLLRTLHQCRAPPWRWIYRHVSNANRIVRGV